MADISRYFGRMVFKHQIYSTGSGTWTLPTKIIKDSSGNAVVWVTACGGGGGGAGGNSAAMGGCSGEYVQRCPLSVSGNLSYSIGSGGSGGTSADGTDGSDTTIGSWTLEGGLGGKTNGIMKGDFTTLKYGQFTEHDAGIQNEVGNQIRCPGQFGGMGGVATEFHAGAGGLVIDNSGSKGADVSTVGAGGIGYGAGGGAGNNVNNTGGAGEDGVVMLEWWEYV